MELKDRIQKLLRRGDFACAAIFQGNAPAEAWELVDVFALRNRLPRPQ